MISRKRALLHEWLARALAASSLDWLEEAQHDVGAGVSDARFCGLLALASRHIPGGRLSPTSVDRSNAFDLCEGWNPERWTLLETARVALVLARYDLDDQACVSALDEAFRYADVGEACALQRSLTLLPGPERFVWRAGEGCRSSMRAIFEAAACDTPFPFVHFDDRAWRQLVIKCLFVEAPLWRVYGLDRRLDDELARMALDLADERRAAGRTVRHELWLCLGRHGGARGRALFESELDGCDRLGRRAAAIALARAGALTRLAELFENERDPEVRTTMELALKGHIHSGAFQALDLNESRDENGLASDTLSASGAQPATESMRGR